MIKFIVGILLGTMLAILAPLVGVDVFGTNEVVVENDSLDNHRVALLEYVENRGGWQWLQQMRNAATPSSAVGEIASRIVRDAQSPESETAGTSPVEVVAAEMDQADNDDVAVSGEDGTYGTTGGGDRDDDSMTGGGGGEDDNVDGGGDRSGEQVNLYDYYAENWNSKVDELFAALPPEKISAGGLQKEEGYWAQFLKSKERFEVRVQAASLSNLRLKKLPESYVLRKAEMIQAVSVDEGVQNSEAALKAFADSEVKIDEYEGLVNLQVYIIAGQPQLVPESESDVLSKGRDFAEIVRESTHLLSRLGAIYDEIENAKDEVVSREVAEQRLCKHFEIDGNPGWLYQAIERADASKLEDLQMFLTELNSSASELCMEIQRKLNFEFLLRREPVNQNETASSTTQSSGEFVVGPNARNATRAFLDELIAVEGQRSEQNRRNKSWVEELIDAIDKGVTRFWHCIVLGKCGGGNGGSGPESGDPAGENEPSSGDGAAGDADDESDSTNSTPSRPGPTRNDQEEESGEEDVPDQPENTNDEPTGVQDPDSQGEYRIQRWNLSDGSGFRFQVWKDGQLDSLKTVSIASNSADPQIQQLASNKTPLIEGAVGNFANGFDTTPEFSLTFAFPGYPDGLAVHFRGDQIEDAYIPYGMTAEAVKELGGTATPFPKPPGDAESVPLKSFDGEAAFRLDRRPSQIDIYILRPDDERYRVFTIGQTDGSQHEALFNAKEFERVEYSTGSDVGGEYLLLRFYEPDGNNFGYKLYGDNRPPERVS